MYKIAEVPPIQQKTNWTCSAACLKAVLAHWGCDVPEMVLIGVVRARKNRGAETTDIVQGAKKLGFDALEFSFDSLDQAKALLDMDVPIIADIQSFLHPGKGHYVVITGIDDQVDLMDPNTPGNHRRISRQEMEERWWDRWMAPPHQVMKKWGIVVFPEGALPGVQKIDSGSSELEKQAKIISTLQPHQQRVVDRIMQEDQPGLVVAHGLGSGKTLSSIAAQEALGLPSTVVVPAALQANYQKEWAKHVRDQGVPQIESLQRLSRGQEPINTPAFVLDEAHRIRNPESKAYRNLAKNEAQKRLLLTASPFYNDPSDIAPLVNIAAGSKVFPLGKKEFAQRYIEEIARNPGFLGRLQGIKPGIEKGLNPDTQKELASKLNKWVDYQPSSQEHFPTVKREDIRVPMTPEQLKTYDALIGEAPPWVAWKIKRGLPPSKQESKQLNAFLSAARQASNTTAGFQTEGLPQEPKIQRAFEELQKSLAANQQGKAVVYSNYLTSGLDPYKKRLSEAGIPFGEFTGSMPKSKRDEIVRQYNEGKLKALLLSSAGGEGLDLKGTRLIQLLEPHWNEEKLHQVEGRGIRYKSHEDLPPEARNVLVQRFLATRPRTGLLERLKLSEPGGAVDEYLVSRAAEKEALMNQLRGLLEKRAAEDPRVTAEDIRHSLARRYNVSPFLSGSLATGLNLPGKADYDYGVTVFSRPKFEGLVNRLRKTPGVENSPYNKPGSDYHVFTLQSPKDPKTKVDFALMYGQKGRDVRHGVETAKSRAAALPEEEVEKILSRKRLFSKLKSMPIVGDLSWKGKPLVSSIFEKPWKRSLDKSLGLIRIKREPLEEMEKSARLLTKDDLSRLSRSDVFAHRTGDPSAIMQSGSILPAAQLARKGWLKEIEAPSLFRSRQKLEGPTELRTQVFATKGLLPSSDAYGRYGVLFEKRKIDKSPYLNLVPNEYVTNRISGKSMTYVVPDEEATKWNRKFPDRRIIRESDVPDRLRIQSGRSVGSFFKKLLSGDFRIGSHKELVTPKGVRES